MHWQAADTVGDHSGQDHAGSVGRGALFNCPAQAPASCMTFAADVCEDETSVLLQDRRWRSKHFDYSRLFKIHAAECMQHFLYFQFMIPTRHNLTFVAAVDETSAINFIQWESNECICHTEDLDQNEFC